MSNFVKLGFIFALPLSVFAMGASAISPSSIGTSASQSVTTTQAAIKSEYVAAKPMKRRARLLPRATSTRLTTLVMFNGTNGANPKSALIQDRDGNFLGTASLGGANNQGVVFRITPTGQMTTLASFSGKNGANPYGSLVEAPDGYFYGTTLNGGTYGFGTVFRMTPSGQITVLESFNGSNGAYPYSALIIGSDQNLYGTTNQGGTSRQGTVFRITPAGQLTTLVNFSNFRGTGTHPKGALYLAKDGNYYGLTPDGGNSGIGTAYRITPTGQFSVLTHFTSATSGVSRSALMQHSSGDEFYGAMFGDTKAGDDGALFKMTPAGQVTTLVKLGGIKGARGLAPMIEGQDGLLYGTIRKYGSLPTRKETGLGFGVIFAMTPEGQQSILHVFTGPKDGGHPENALIQDQAGAFYGTTFEGGTYQKGTIFKLEVNSF